MTIIGYPQEYVKLALSKKSTLLWTLNCIAGSLFLALMSKITIPLPYSPVPISMQTFALFILVMTQGKNRAAGSVLLYLVQATCGMPVLATGINPLWMLSPTAGYLFGFLGCTLLAGYLIEKRARPSFIHTFVALIAGLSVIYCAGTLFLSLFVPGSQAFAVGTLPFIGVDLLKAGAAAALFAPASWMKNKLLEMGF
jgi:biotin transport system substrate-specific component